MSRSARSSAWARAKASPAACFTLPADATRFPKNAPGHVTVPYNGGKAGQSAQSEGKALGGHELGGIMAALLGLLFFVGPFIALGIWLWLRSRREPVLLSRPFDIGHVIGRTFNIFGPGNGPVFVGALLIAGFSGATGVLVFNRGMAPGTVPGGAAAAQMLNPMFLISGLFGLLLAVAFNVFAVRLRVAQMQGSPVSVRDALMATPRLVLPALALWILAYLGVMAGIFAFVLPGVVLALSWTVTVPALICEKTGIIGAFKRSRALSIGSRGRIFIVGLMMIALTIVAILPFMGLGLAGLGVARTAVSVTIVRAVVNVPLTMIYTNCVAAIYVELCTIREGQGAPALSEVFA